MTRHPLPLSALGMHEAEGLVGLIFDLDDTVLDHGALTEAAFATLFRLRESGLRLVACTGRPAGWAGVIARQWPIDGAIAENGAVAFVRTSSRVEVLFPGEGVGVSERRASLERLALALIERFPTAALADDNAARMTDVTIDVGEHRHVSADDVRTMCELARAEGIETLVSSVHLHLTCETTDKARGALRLLQERFGETNESGRASYAFVGDSGNDAAAFAAFSTTIGVANVASWLPRLPVAPRYVTQAAMGRGFAELGAHLVRLRAHPG